MDMAKMTNTKWQRAYALQEMGTSEMLIAKRCGWSMAQTGEELKMMRACGLNPRWREDMQVAQERVSDLEWQINRQRELRFDA